MQQALTLCLLQIADVKKKFFFLKIYFICKYNFLSYLFKLDLNLANCNSFMHYRYNCCPPNQDIELKKKLLLDIVLSVL